VITSKIETLKMQIERAEANDKGLKASWLYGKLLWATCQLVMLDIINEIKQGTKSE